MKQVTEIFLKGESPINLIINSSHLYTSNMRISTYIDRVQAFKQ